MRRQKEAAGERFRKSQCVSKKIFTKIAGTPRLRQASATDLAKEKGVGPGRADALAHFFGENS